MMTEAAKPGPVARSRAERRGADRLPLTLEADAIAKDGRSVPILILDVSRQGCLFASDLPDDFGRHVTVSVAICQYEAPATIAWEGDGLHGCHFHRSISKADLSALRLRGAPSSLSADPASVGKELARIRKQHGISSTHVAEQLGVSRPTLWAWETGKSVPSRENMPRVRSWLQMTAGSREAGETFIDPASLSGMSDVEAVVEEHRNAMATQLSIHSDRIRVTIEF